MNTLDHDVQLKNQSYLNLKKRKERGCTEPMYGKKAKCVIKIVPQDKKCKTFPNG